MNIENDTKWKELNNRQKRCKIDVNNNKEM